MAQDQGGTARKPSSALLSRILLQESHSSRQQTQARRPWSIANPAIRFRNRKRIPPRGGIDKVISCVLYGDDGIRDADRAPGRASPDLRSERQETAIKLPCGRRHGGEVSGSASPIAACSFGCKPLLSFRDARASKELPAPAWLFRQA